MVAIISNITSLKVEETNENEVDNIDIAKNGLHNNTYMPTTKQNVLISLKFTDFIQNVIKNINNYTDNDLEKFFAVFNDEVKNYHYKGCKFKEITENYAFRTFLSGLFYEFKTQPGELIKKKLEKIAKKMRRKQYNKKEKVLFKVINSLYREDSVDSYIDFLVNIDNYNKKNTTNLNLRQILQDGLRNIIFDYYSHLNVNDRRALQWAIKDYWKYLSEKLQIPDNGPGPTRVENNETTTTSTEKHAITKQKVEPELADTDIDDVENINIIKSIRKVNKHSLYLQNLSKKMKKYTINCVKNNKHECIQNLNENDRLIYQEDRTQTNIFSKPAEYKTNNTSNTTSMTSPTYSLAKENLYLKYETDAYEYLTHTESNKKWPTYKNQTSKNKDPQWTLARSINARRQLSFRTPKERPYEGEHYIWEKDQLSDDINNINGRRVNLFNGLDATFSVDKISASGVKDKRNKKLKEKQDEISTQVRTKKQVRYRKLEDIYNKVRTTGQTEITTRRWLSQSINDLKKSLKVSESQLSLENDSKEIFRNKDQKSKKYSRKNDESNKMKVMQSNFSKERVFLDSSNEKDNKNARLNVMTSKKSKIGKNYLNKSSKIIGQIQLDNKANKSSNNNIILQKIENNSNISKIAKNITAGHLLTNEATTTVSIKRKSKNNILHSSAYFADYVEHFEIDITPRAHSKATSQKTTKNIVKATPRTILWPLSHSLVTPQNNYGEKEKAVETVQVEIRKDGDANLNTEENSIEGPDSAIIGEPPPKPFNEDIIKRINPGDIVSEQFPDFMNILYPKEKDTDEAV